MKIIKQKGVSLLEVLISVLVLSVGLLGLGGLQLHSLKSSNDAHFRTVASFLASDLGDRIRINPEGVALAGYEISESQSTSICENTTPKLCTESNTCSVSELATFDLYQIACGVKKGSNVSLGMKNLLPSATLSVDCGGVTCDGDTEHTITLKWVQTDNQDADNDVQVRTLVWNILP
jgi:type IV pilus assembly protein PilV